MQPPESTGPDLVKYLTWFEVHKKRIGLWAAIVVVLIAVLIGVVESRAHREARASRALSEVRGPRSFGEAPASQVIEAYLRVAREYAGTKAAERALLLAAAGFYTAQQFAEAQKQFEGFLKRYPDSQWLAEAALGVAACLNAQGRTNDAVSKYEEVRRRFGHNPVADDAKLALARLFEGQGKHEDAYKLYDELAKPQPGGRSGLAMEAQMRLQELLRQHPQLARPKQPPVSITPTPTPQATGTVALAQATNAAGAGTNPLTMLTGPPPEGTTGLLSATNLQQLTNLLQVPPNAAAAQTSSPAVPTNAPATNLPLLLQSLPATNR